MKKIVLFMMICFLILSKQAHAIEDIVPQAASAYLMEVSSGKVILEKNAQEKLYPASMTKMMSLILVFEALNEKKLSLDEIINVSENAASMGGSQVYLEVGEQISVHDLLKATIIASANDAMVALAERISGSVSGFVEAMNQKAKEYGLINTQFTNTTGLHDENHFTCAQDMAIIASYLLQTGKEKLLEYSSTYDAYIREKSPNPFWLVNTNKLIKYVDGVDGLKTGFTQEAKSCITVTALRNGLRLIAVVMKEPDSKIRNKEVSELIDFGFSKIELQPLFKKGEVVEEQTFDLGNPKKMALVYLNPVGVVVEKGKTVSIVSKEVLVTRDIYPYIKGECVGEVKLTFDNQEIQFEPIGVQEDVFRLTFMQLFKINFWNLLT